MKLTGAEIIIETLIDLGVETVFGYPGGAVLNIYDALYDRQDRIRHYLTAHEQGAAHAADGYARATGKTGVVIATSGPGATNLVTGIANAYMDSIPLVAITGNVVSQLIGRDSFQEVHITGITLPVTKHNYLITSTKDLAHTIREAFRIANEGRPGPVLIDIPKDFTIQSAEFESAGPRLPGKKYPFPPDAVEQAAELINASERPVIYFGGGVIHSGASREIEALAQKAQIPFCSSMMGLGAVPHDHPLNLGMVGMHGKVAASKAVDESDLLIAIGARFSDRVATSSGRFAPDAKRIHIDIDAAEIGKNVGVSLDIVGDVREVLEHLLEKVRPNRHDQWVSKAAAWKEKYDRIPAITGDAIKPWEVLQALHERIGGDEIIVTDVGQHQMWTAQYYPLSQPRTWITSGGLGTMGFGMGAAIGAQLGKPDKRVVLITSDGSFHMNLNELCTLVSYNIPVTVVILNNHVLGMVRQWQTLFLNKRYSFTTLDRKTDYVKLSEAFGAVGFRVTDRKELGSVLDRALNAGGPSVVDCVIDRNEKVIPMIPTGKTVYEIITE